MSGSYEGEREKFRVFLFAGGRVLQKPEKFIVFTCERASRASGKNFNLFAGGRAGKRRNREKYRTKSRIQEKYYTKPRIQEKYHHICKLFRISTPSKIDRFCAILCDLLSQGKRKFQPIRAAEIIHVTLKNENQPGRKKKKVRRPITMSRIQKLFSSCAIGRRNRES